MWFRHYPTTNVLPRITTNPSNHENFTPRKIPAIRYAEQVFIPYLIDQLRNSTRIDVVWDTYIADSLKESTREKRGKGLRRKVSSQTKLPGNWMDFLPDSTNKKELFAFLTSKVVEFTQTKLCTSHLVSLWCL